MRAVKEAVISAMGAWLAYAFSDDEAGKAHLQRANHLAVTTHRRADLYMPGLTLAIFIAIEARHFDFANELLDKAMGYRAFIKTNAPARYAELCYLYALLEIYQNRTRSARKHWHNLLEASPTHSLETRVMLGRLHLAMGEYEDAYAQLAGAFAGGCRSPYVYEGLYRYYQTARVMNTGAELLRVLYYAAKRGADIVGICADAQAAISEAIEKDYAAGEALFAVSRYYPLLKDICPRRIRRDDTSPKAYALYSSAVHRQIILPGLYTQLVKTAYANGIEGINRYTLAQYLQSAVPDDELAVYVYHLMLTDPEHADLLTANSNKILQFTARCLAQGVKGRYANSLYCFYWARCRAMQLTDAQTELAESFIQADLTRYELEVAPNSAVRFVYITDAAKRGTDVYEVPENRRFTAEAAGADFSYTCLGAGARTVLHEELTVRPMTANADIAIFRYFFDKGDKRYYLLRALADEYMENPGPTAIEVLEAMLTQKNLLKAYRMRLLLTLGQIHFDTGAYEKAHEAYASTDENTPGLPARLLQIHLHTCQYTQAAALIGRKHTQLDHDVLLEAINTLLPYEECHADLADAAQGLLMGEMLPALVETPVYDALLELTLTHFAYSQAELVKLADSLAPLRLPDPRVDKRILEGSLWMATLDTHAQTAFVRLYKNPNCAPLILPFVRLCTFRMLTTAFRPEYETIDTLEKHYYAVKETEADNLLGLALGQTYLRYNLTTLRSERIIDEALANQQENGLLLPAFKEYKPAQIPFIEKHQPFLYKGLPGKEVYLNYRFTTDAPFTAKAMEYLRFGLYLTCLPLFYNEEITYYFSEELPTGSITTREFTHKNTTPYLRDMPSTAEDDDGNDLFFVINNAIILEQMFRHEQVEGLITGLVNEVTPVHAGLM
jgi:hypothetical protein